MVTFSPNPFDTLPIETNRHIASTLEYDTDVCNFRRICRSTLDAVDADNNTFWRRRFVSHFEDCCWPRAQNVKYRVSYQTRKRLLKNGAVFTTGETRKERKCLELIRDLAVESFSGESKDLEKICDSLNLQHIKRFLLSTNLLQAIFMPKLARAPTTRFNTSGGRHRPYSPTPKSFDTKPTDLLLTVQVLCAPMLLSFEPHLSMSHFGFPDSQAVMYSTPSTWPIFGGVNGLDVNMEFVLHNINFWKYHMLREEEQTLFWAFQDLDEDDRPRWWSSKLQQPSTGAAPKLGKHWKGSYAYIERDEVEAMRSGKRDVSQISDQIQDCFAGEDAASFQDLQLSLLSSSEQQNFPWPAAFERHLHSLTLPAPTRQHPQTRAQKRQAAASSTLDSILDLQPQSFRFDGTGTDVAESFLASGWLNPLPPQQGVPGWQRMTMMKYFEDNTDPMGVDVNALWAYEGVVSPGGEIVVGRWWSVMEGGEGEMYSGPFILWCVDGPKYEAMEREEGVEKSRMAMD